eukprot:gene39943-52729_t
MRLSVPCGANDDQEYPVEWMTRHLERSGLRILRSKNFTILHSEDSMMRQLRVAQSKLALMPNIALKQGMQAYLQELGERIQVAARMTDGGRIPLSFDYVIAAEIPDTATAAADDANADADQATTESMGM